MMKCNILAIIIPVLLAGTTNAAEIYNKDSNILDLYGKVNARHFFVKNSNIQDGDNSGVVFGIFSSTKISDQLSGFAHIELETKINKNIEIGYKNTISYVGLKFAKFNSLDYGRNYGVMYDINSWTDVLPLYGTDSIFQNDNYMCGKNRNLLTYRNTNFFGLINGFNFTLQYQGKNNEITSKEYNDINSKLKTNGEGYGISANYNIGWGITFGGSYTKSKRNNDTIINNNDTQKPKNAEGWNAGIKYDTDNIYLAAMYGKTNYMTRFGSGNDQNIIGNNIAKKAEHVELVAQYSFAEIGLKPSIAYIESKGENLLDANKNSKYQNIVKYSSVGIIYSFNKNLTGMIDYKINLIHENEFTKHYNISKNNIIGLGLVYKF